MAFFIRRCFDSHVHWPELGEVKSYLDLSQLRSPFDLKSIIPATIDPQRGDWILGFGWNENSWNIEDRSSFNRYLLDEIFPHNPVCLIRADGHAVCVNTQALIRAKIDLISPDSVPGGEFVKGKDGTLSGVLIDSAKFKIDEMIPKIDVPTLVKHLILGQEVFVAAGFTHVRDMGFTEDKWKAAKQLEELGLLQLYAEVNFAFESVSEFEPTLRLIQKLKLQSSKHLRVAGIKFYIDGALGSEGALLSKPYLTSGKSGLQLFTQEEIESFLLRSWQMGIAVAVHALGDAASEILATAALKVIETSSVKGELHVEHAEVTNFATLKKLANLGARLHFQPCHFLSDQSFLKNKIGDRLDQVFQWGKCEELGIPFSFGSDAPIELPSLKKNQFAVEEVRRLEISDLIIPWFIYHQHPDITWGGDCYTEILESGEIQRIFV